MKKSTYYQTIRKLAKRVGKKFHPKKIILFGSYASGVPNKDSDVDLLVIFFWKRQAKHKNIKKWPKPWNQDPFPIDLLVRSSQEIQNRLKNRGFIYRRNCYRGQSGSMSPKYIKEWKNKAGTRLSNNNHFIPSKKK